MAIPYFPHSGRRAHYWKIRNKGFRDLMMSKKWHFRGAYAEKFINGRAVMQMIVEKHPDYFLCCFRWKDDFWSEISTDFRQKEAEKFRSSFKVVKPSKNTSNNRPDPLGMNDFCDKAKLALENREKRDSLLVKRLGTYGAHIAAKLLMRMPHLTTEEAITMVEEET